MSSPAPSLDTVPDGASASAALPGLDQQVAQLDRLAQAGVALALDLERRVTQAATGDPLVADPKAWQAIALVFSRTSRAVRLTYAFRNRLLKGVAARPVAGKLAICAAEAQPGGPDVCPGQNPVGPHPLSRQATVADRAAPILDPEAQAIREIRARNIVGLVIDRLEPDAASCQRLIREAGEYLYDREVLGERLDRPFCEVVAYICDQLGLSPDWDSLAQTPWAQREIGAGVPYPPVRWWAARPVSGLADAPPLRPPAPA